MKERRTIIMKKKHYNKVCKAYKANKSDIAKKRSFNNSTNYKDTQQINRKTDDSYASG